MTIYDDVIDIALLKDNRHILLIKHIYNGKENYLVRVNNSKHQMVISLYFDKYDKARKRFNDIKKTSRRQ